MHISFYGKLKKGEKKNQNIFPSTHISFFITIHAIRLSYVLHVYTPLSFVCLEERKKKKINFYSLKTDERRRNAKKREKHFYRHQQKQFENVAIEEEGKIANK